MESVSRSVSQSVSQSVCLSILGYTDMTQTTQLSKGSNINKISALLLSECRIFVSFLSTKSGCKEIPEV